MFNLLIGTLQKHEGLSDVSLIDAEALWAGVHGICVLANNGKIGVIHQSVPKNLLTVYIHTFLSGLSKIRDVNLVEKFSE